MVERVADPEDRRAKRIRFSRLGYAALMHGLGVLRDLEGELWSAVGHRRMRDLHETLPRRRAGAGAVMRPRRARVRVR